MPTKLTCIAIIQTAHLLHYYLDNYEPVPNNKTMVIVLWYQTFRELNGINIIKKIIPQCCGSNVVPFNTSLYPMDF